MSVGLFDDWKKQFYLKGCCSADILFHAAYFICSCTSSAQFTVTLQNGTFTQLFCKWSKCLDLQRFVDIFFVTQLRYPHSHGESNSLRVTSRIVYQWRYPLTAWGTNTIHHTRICTQIHKGLPMTPVTFVCRMISSGLARLVDFLLTLPMNKEGHLSSWMQNTNAGLAT